ncbi:mechanosensitive ion channel family protein [Sphingopyxis sp. R3-92]|uniref:mechanosensitive ion channel family protein n=1 Tax=Sphingopyxis sp. R3-92 TaxID=3158553 RepID=UPI003EE64747
MTEAFPTVTDIPILAGTPPWAETLIALVALGTVAWLANFIVRRTVLRFVLRTLPYDGPTPAPIAARLANIVPALIITSGIGAVPHLPQTAAIVVGNVVSASIILFAAMAIGEALGFANQLYERRPGSASRPVKGYVQVLKILVYAGAAILIVAALMEQSPLLLLSGLGAMAAVLMLVFKDTILSLVASVQLTSNDMLRVGDWIEMPQLHADGDVIDIALHTIKVQNWDKTITTIPTHRLIAESFKNWRGMAESGGRRIKRSLLLDQNCIRFLSTDERQELRRIALIRDYLGHKEDELGEWNSRLGDAGREPANARHVTNIGTFRAYVEAYLRANAGIADGMTLIVRQLAPTPQGLPLEVYCFTGTTAWSDYENIQADIFDHLLAILPTFRLRPFQEPSGRDLQTRMAA